ncbi:hypothetical protein M0813_07991 [Anaeramoeba flamelloides]|uniref:Uncharacterized protein n=1 Tax=Anaeramoeba flamelloides TaxID=1746091 RepID=A0ABQ8X9V6_9EUKA|nr:hypothetical protein M0813_07991 [Anaeramoeba flamelloides]
MFLWAVGRILYSRSDESPSIVLNLVKRWISLVVGAKQLHGFYFEVISVRTPPKFEPLEHQIVFECIGLIIIISSILTSRDRF